MAPRSLIAAHQDLNENNEKYKKAKSAGSEGLFPLERIRVAM